jgi:hypothetical protein
MIKITEDADLDISTRLLKDTLEIATDTLDDMSSSLLSPVLGRYLSPMAFCRFCYQTCLISNILHFLRGYYAEDDEKMLESLQKFTVSFVFLNIDFCSKLNGPDD